MIDVENFSFSYDEHEAPVLENLSFSQNKGETLLLLGPSGSGKSTLALCLNGLYPTAIDGFTEGSYLSVWGKKSKNTFPVKRANISGSCFKTPKLNFVC